MHAAVVDGDLPDLLRDGTDRDASALGAPTGADARAPRFQARGQKYTGVSNFAQVPGLGRPPLVVPTERHVAAAALRHFSRQRARATRLTTKLLSFLLTSGFGGVAMRGQMRIEAVAGDDTIETYLADLLGQDIMVSVYVGPARATCGGCGTARQRRRRPARRAGRFAARTHLRSPSRVRCAALAAAGRRGPGHSDPLAAATASAQGAQQLLVPFGIQPEQARIMRATRTPLAVRDGRMLTCPALGGEGSWHDRPLRS
jgi:hypothetical protein